MDYRQAGYFQALEHWNVGWQDYTVEHNLDSPVQITPRHAAKRIRDVLKELDPDALIEVGDCKAQLNELEKGVQDGASSQGQVR